ncbi:MAG: ACP S-malonyltransferase [Candidatus Cloacimonetes bacterium]|nr:ACP S-malonyltransferase [Candidatus Cloacimonadota bacterium]
MRKKIAFVFPGQGSQSVGMGKLLAEQAPWAQEAYLSLDKNLGISLSRYCFEGPESELLRTEITQPAIVATSSLLCQSLIREGISPDCTAGHSVGEYSALVASGALDIESAVSLVHIRGKLMDAACPQGTGSMAALIGMNEEQVTLMIEKLDLGGESLDIAGLNCPGQVVIAGHVNALKTAVEKIREFGGRMGMMLSVSGPFHSRLMASAERELSEKLQAASFTDAKIPVYPNVNPVAVTDREKIKACLMAQLTKPVLWEKTIVQMIADGVVAFVEFGGGNVLSGMIRKIDKQAQVYPVSEPKDVAKVCETLRSNQMVGA